MHGIRISQRIAQAVDRRLGAMHLLLDNLGALAIRRRKRRNIRQQFRVAKYGGEGIADFVGSPGGQAPKRGKFLRVSHARLHGFQVFKRGLGQTQRRGSLASVSFRIPAR